MSPQGWKALLAAGLGLALLSLLADPLGLGAAPGFGWRQTLLLLLGLVVAAFAGVRLRKLGGS
jgi:hypothetical protein